MKKITVGVVIAGLSIAVLLLALRVRRLSPSDAYEYQFRSDIDADYYDQSALRDYYATGYAVGSFAREMWKDRCIDVRMPDADNSSEKAAALHYNSLKAHADSLGARLARSLQLKGTGLRNADIRRLETEDLNPAELAVLRRYGSSMLKSGDRNEGVFLMQGALKRLGYDIPTDGYYWVETEAAVKDFQSRNQLFPSGIADTKTLMALEGK